MTAESQLAVLGQQDLIRELLLRIEKLEASLAAEKKKESLSLLCFSDDWDRIFASFTVANGALAMGKEVHMFFTFWGLAALRKKTESEQTKSLVDRLLAGMLPSAAESASLSKMNFGGLGKVMLRRRMKDRGVAQLDQLIHTATELGVHIHVCELSADLLGLSPQDLTGAGPVELCGVATFLGHAMNGQAVLCI